MSSRSLPGRHDNVGHSDGETHDAETWVLERNGTRAYFSPCTRTITR